MPTIAGFKVTGKVVRGKSAISDKTWWWSDIMVEDLSDNASPGERFKAHCVLNRTRRDARATLKSLRAEVIARIREQSFDHEVNLK